LIILQVAVFQAHITLSWVQNQSDHALGTFYQLQHNKRN